MLASQKGRLQVVKYLLAKKADLHTEDEHKFTALMQVCLTSSEVVSSLKAHENYTDHLNLQRISILEQLLDRNASLVITQSNGTEVSALTVAAYVNNSDAIDILVRKARFSQEQIIEALIIASYVGNPIIINILSQGVIDLKYPRILTMSAEGNATAVRVALDDLNITPNVQFVHGLTPLMIAASCGHIELIDALVRAGADVNAKDNSGKTALDIVSHEYIRPINSQVISTLEKHGAATTYNDSSSDGQSPTRTPQASVGSLLVDSFLKSMLNNFKTNFQILDMMNIIISLSFKQYTDKHLYLKNMI
jgi:ankyrin repeat protein